MRVNDFMINYPSFFLLAKFDPVLTVIFYLEWNLTATEGAGIIATGNFLFLQARPATGTRGKYARRDGRHNGT